MGRQASLWQVCLPPATKRSCAASAPAKMQMHESTLQVAAHMTPYPHISRPRHLPGDLPPGKASQQNLASKLLEAYAMSCILSDSKNVLQVCRIQNLSSCGTSLVNSNANSENHNH